MRAAMSFTLSADARLGCDGLQYVVADLVAERVVQLLESVDVDEGKRERPTMALRSLDLDAQPLLKDAVVDEPRQPIGLRVASQLVEIAITGRLRDRDDTDAERQAAGVQHAVKRDLCGRSAEGEGPPGAEHLVDERLRLGADRAQLARRQTDHARGAEGRAKRGVPFDEAKIVVEKPDSEAGPRREYPQASPENRRRGGCCYPDTCFTSVSAERPYRCVRVCRGSMRGSFVARPTPSI